MGGEARKRTGGVLQRGCMRDGESWRRMKDVTDREREEQARGSITGTGQHGSERPLYTARGTQTNMESL